MRIKIYIYLIETSKNYNDDTLTIQVLLTSMVLDNNTGGSMEISMHIQITC